MQYLLIPIIISMIVHLIKIISELIRNKFNWKRVFGYGGMPSSHAALVTSLATVVYLTEGFSITFAIAGILAIIVMRDAIGFRGYLSTHSRTLNKLIKDLPDEEEYKYPVLEETIAHTMAQVTVGGLLGIILTWLTLIIF